jgi:type III secretion protein U
MSGTRSEAPTPRRLREARRRGELPEGRDLTGAAALLGGLAALGATGPGLVAALADLLRSALSGAGPAPEAALTRGAVVALRLVLAPGLGALAAATLAGGLQTGFALAPAALSPRPERLDPFRGLARLASREALLRVLLGLGKGALLAALSAGWLAGALPALAGLPRAGGTALWRVLPLLSSLAFRLGLAFLALGAADALLARRLHARALRMTRDEVRRDSREDEGQPEHRAERRRLHRALLQAGPVAAATVVVTNPTHLAVALRHERGGDGAPRVLAKGAGRDAARIRSAARRAGVPLVRDVGLARALFRLAEVGDEIPEELYQAAAALLAHLYGAPGGGIPDAVGGPR